MKQAVIHIPHSSTRIPILEGYTVNGDFLEKEILKLTDWYTDDLFYSENDIIIKANFSRIFCDPERFADDEQEVMARFGMGVLYTKSDEGKLIRDITPELRTKILNGYYWVHHNALTNAVKNQLDEYGQSLIIDGHSFPHIPLKRSLDKNLNRPDFNIGTDLFHTSPKLVEASETFFNDRGFSLGIDWPYTGSIVPLEYYRKNPNVQSIMLEVNRKLYLKEDSNEKSESYLEIKKVVGEFVKTMKNIEW
ncbi:N-formylglutamate amidohydrolase [Kaistella flava (ex Peng et al. 2021)]|uniref:N-formylglutamate amidohydrolase n=1 Tax=Kaistella flava (ex Peng et al. 2021) TaxID=2038776 RepID=A0A7M2Y6S6_9FLAO|nr:N-formylglutamate amidohydrolase [Kaistella flava (ex Peng et al. 2021)]QOW09790.1 N-formylglutamate amidohydrolase [Kaistella flava (ex Peng et al. 2021)]